MQKSILVGIYIILMTSMAYAHPPSDINENYDNQTGKLTLFIKHEVREVDKHYIKKIVIKRNSKQLDVKEFRKQENAEGQTLVYIIPEPNETDVIVVQAYCNRFGSRKKEIK